MEYRACRRPDRGGRGRHGGDACRGSLAKVLIDRSAGAELLVLGPAYPAGQPAGELSPPMGSVARAGLHGVACPVVVMPAGGAACMPAHDGGVPVPHQAVAQP